MKINRLLVFALGVIGTAMVGCAGGGGGSALPTPDKEALILVADTGTGRVARFDDMKGKNFNAKFMGIDPVCLALESTGRVYFTTTDNTVARVDDLGGSAVTVYGETGTGVGQFDGPTGVAVDSQRRIYIADSLNNRIVRMDNMLGDGWTTIGTAGGGIGQFQSPSGIRIDSTDRLYVVDTGNNRIVRMDDIDGMGWTTYGSNGSGVGNFNGPIDIALGPAGGIFITDRLNSRIVRIDDMTGSNWATYSVLGPITLDLDRHSRIYFTKFGDRSRVTRIDGISGANATTYGEPGDGTGLFTSLSGIVAR